MKDLKRRPDERLHLVKHFKNDVDSLFKNFFGDLETSSFFKSDFVPKIDVTEDEKFIHVKAELPGAKKEDVEVNLKDNHLTIKGEKKEEKEEGDKKKYYLKETVHGAFERTFTLPSDVEGDKAKASFKDGVLLIEIPKAKNGESNKKVSIE